MMAGGERVPIFRRGVQFRFDAVRDAWVLLAPEKLYLPDEIAVEILQRIDGRRSVDGIVDELAAAFDAPRAEIFADVEEALDGLAGRSVLQW